MLFSAQSFTIKSASDIKEYDGTELRNEDVEIKGLITGHTYEKFGFDSITNIGKIENVFEIKIYDELGNDITGNYEIDYDFGTLEVTQIKLKIETASNEWSYDGASHNDKNYDFIKGSLLPGNEIKIIEFTTIVNPGQVENILIIRIVDEFNNITYEDNGENNLYDIEFVYGTLLITGYLLIKTESAEKTFDGTPLKCEEYTFEVDGKTSMPNGHRLEVKFLASLTTAGCIDNIIEVTIYDKDGNDVTNDYLIEPEFGTLTVKKLDVNITVNSFSTMYSGMPTDTRYASGMITGLESLLI